MSRWNSSAAKRCRKVLFKESSRRSYMTALFSGPRLASLFAVLGLALLSPARGEEPGKQASPLLEAPALSSAAFARINASACGLAGLKAESATWESTSEWRDYQQWLDSRWKYLDRVRLSAMRN